MKRARDEDGEQAGTNGGDAAAQGTCSGVGELGVMMEGCRGKQDAGQGRREGGRKRVANAAKCVSELAARWRRLAGCVRGRQTAA